MVCGMPQVRDEHHSSTIGPQLDHTEWREVHVPGHWADIEPSLTTDGPLTYRTTVNTPSADEGRRRFLTFDGIAYHADVWLDGAYLGDTEGYLLRIRLMSPICGDCPRPRDCSRSSLPTN